MKKRLLQLAMVLVMIALAGVLLADKKTMPTATLTRIEGKADRFLLNPVEITVEKSTSWRTAKGTAGDEPELEFTAGTPQTINLQLMFDSFEAKENVYEKNVKPLEALTAVDPNLGRPDMVKVTWNSNSSGLPSFTGVIESVSTRYTMFLPDGTPARCTTNISMKSASGAGVAPDKPCP